MTASTKERLLRKYSENELLASPAPPLMPSTPSDLRGDQPHGRPTAGITSAAAQALQSGQTHYVDVPGIAPLRTAVASYLKEAFGQAYETENILITAGVQESRFLTIQKIGEQFEELVMPAVVHPGVRQVLGVRDIPFREIPVTEGDGMLVSLDAARAALKPGRRVLYLESPSRLTGQAYPQQAVAELVALVREYDAALIWDQGLAPWQSEGAYVAPVGTGEEFDQVVVFGEAWPGTGLDSWFIGYIAAGPTLLEPMRSQKQIMAICTSTASQYAAVAAKDVFIEQSGPMQKKLVEVRNQVAAIADELALNPLPGNTASLLALRPAGGGSTVQQALDRAGFAISDGAAFGAPGVLRLKITPDNTTVEALRSLA